MARKATLINQDWLRSKTMALAGDTIENIAFRLLLISDDFGRFPDDPEGLRVMMNDIRHTPEQIKEAIDYLVDARTVERYVARCDEREQTICRWVRWEDYQNIKWHDDAKYPDKDGLYEVSNNPKTVARRADKRNVKRTDKRRVKRLDERTVQQKEKEKEEQSESESRARTRELLNDTLKDDDDDNFSDLRPRAERLVQELFPILAKEKYKLDRQIEAIQIICESYSMDEIEDATRWAHEDEFYQLKFIGFRWLLEESENELNKFGNILRQFLDRGGGQAMYVFSSYFQCDKCQQFATLKRKKGTGLNWAIAFKCKCGGVMTVVRGSVPLGAADKAICFSIDDIEEVEPSANQD